MRRAAVRLPATSVSGSRMTNSSPPWRNARSTSRTTPAHPPGELDQHLVADPMAVPVVDGLEVVQVEDEHAEVTAEPGGPLGLPTHRLPQMAQVAQAGERVGDRQSLGLLQVAEDPVEPRARAGRSRRDPGHPRARRQVAGRRPVDRARRAGSAAGWPCRPATTRATRQTSSAVDDHGDDRRRVPTPRGARRRGCAPTGRRPTSSAGATGRPAAAARDARNASSTGRTAYAYPASSPLGPVHRRPGGQPADLPGRHRSPAGSTPQIAHGPGASDGLTSTGSRADGGRQRQPLGRDQQVIALAPRPPAAGPLRPVRDPSAPAASGGGQQRAADEQRAQQDHEEGAREPRAQRHLCLPPSPSCDAVLTNRVTSGKDVARPQTCPSRTSARRRWPVGGPCRPADRDRADRAIAATAAARRRRPAGPGRCAPTPR